MELKNLVLEGVDPQTERSKKNENITFREFAIKEYIPHAKANKKSWADDVSKLENHMYKAFGDIPLDSITTKQLQQYQSKIKTRNSPSTSNRHMTVLIRMFNLAVQWDYLEANPCTNKIKKYREPTKETFLDDHELKSFLVALDNANQSVSVHAIRLLLYTGLRKSEITTLKWSSVDLTNGNLRLLQTKSGKSRTVILNQLAIDTLEKMKEFRVSDWVCPGKGPKGHIVSLRNCFVKLVKEAGITPIRLHDLRHVFASICANAGQSLYSIQTLLGHNSSQMTQRYAHLANKELRAATESVADQIKKLVG